MDKNFKGLVWTDHAIERMREREIKQGDAWATFNSPHSSKKASTKGAFIYYKTFGDVRIEVVAKKDEDKWIIVSVWSRKLINNSTQKGIIKKIWGIIKGNYSQK